MQFLKKHFEKIILSVVLALLGGAAVWLSLAVKEAKVQVEKGPGAPPPAKPWTNLVVGVYSNALEALTNAPEVVLTGEHNLFNSGTWIKLRDGTLRKVTKSGVDALSVTGIRPLYFSITLDSQASDVFLLTARHDYGAGPVHWYGRPGEKAEPRKPYPIVGTNSAPDKPTVMVLQMQIPETGETVTVSSGAPYRKLEGYEADMKYSASDVTNMFSNKHVGDMLPLSDYSFKIIAISSNIVTVQDTRTSQKTDKKWNPGASAAAATEGGAVQREEQQASAKSRTEN